MMITGAIAGGHAVGGLPLFFRKVVMCMDTMEVLTLLMLVFVILTYINDTKK